ncbi:LPXTG cell wall anchor domain-containing protein [Paenibacillus tepidiphilus]|uniref:LPXTG cell wall anchor domain-containing protein n=1 Tax=Paenibacillus tepidiphilus TaxID=2608683 RepID=UPI0013A57753|nr:LPXTG cell wall anchor domain-containing protein [Paenibacillus tepidiphilus]
MAKKRISLAVVLFMLFVQTVTGIGLAPQATAAGIEGERDIITSVSMAVYGPDGQTVTGAVYDVDSTVTLDYTWALPNEHGYSAGDTFTFQLPEQFQLFNDINGSLASDDGDVGVFSVSHSTHQVTLTFNSYIESHDNVHGTLRINTQFDKAVIGGSITVPILFPINGGTETIVVLFQPQTGSVIEKSGVSSGFNAREIHWTVDVNKRLQSIAGAIVTDPVPAGLALPSTATVAVYSLNVSLDGTAVQGGLVDPGKYTAEISGGALVVRFTEPVITGAYRIAYTTDVTGNDSSYTNTATLTGDGRDPASASATVTIERGPSLHKKVFDYQWGSQIIVWNIEYNYNNGTVPQQYAVLTDLFDDLVSLVPDSLLVYPVTLDAAGKVTKGTPLVPDTDYTVKVVTKEDRKGFELSFKHDVTSPYLIEYKTKADGRVYKDTTITNTVTDSVYTDEARQVIRPAIIYKTLSGVNYKNQTTEWKVTINGDSQPMKEVVVTDGFPQGGQKLIPESVAVKSLSGAVLPGSAYTLEYASPVQPNASFKVKFKSPISGPYVISYTTYFNSDWIVASTEDFKNLARVEWKDIEGKREASAEGLFIPRAESKNNGFKNGSYNAAAKEITWNIGVNYNAKTVADPVVSDTLTAGQSLVPGSLKVYNLNVEANGNYSRGTVLGETAYSYSVAGGELKIEFASEIHSPYVIEFKTSLDGKLIAGKVDNAARLLDGTKRVSKELRASVTIPYGGEYIVKDGVQSGDKVGWSVMINRSQSHVKDAKIIDTPSNNQLLLPDSFHLYPTVVAPDGKVTKSGPELAKGTDYALQVLTDSEGKQSFELSFLHDIDTAYILEYESLINANTGDKLVNTAAFSGSNEVLVEKDTTKEVIVGVSSGSGTGSGVRGSLIVAKLDGADRTTPLAGATFELYRLNGTDRVLVNTLTTDAAGGAVFRNLWLGSYVLIETAAPAGYIRDSAEYPVTIGSSAAVNLAVYNTAVAPTATATPVPTASTSPEPTASATTSPVPTASATTSPVPTASATASPVPTASATASPVPTASATASPVPTASATTSPVPTASATASPVPTAAPTPGGTTVPGVTIDDEEVPAGGVTTPAVSPTPPVTGGGTPDEIIIDDEVPQGGATPDEVVIDDEVPQGTVTDSGGQLPQTGENSPLPIYLTGLGLILAGVILSRVYRRSRKQE